MADPDDVSADGLVRKVLTGEAGVSARAAR